MNSLNFVPVLAVLMLLQSCLNLDLFNSDDIEQSEAETPTFSIDMDRYTYSLTAGQNPGDVVKVPHDTLTFFEEHIRLTPIEISAAAVVDLSYEGSTISVSTRDNATAPHNIQVILVYQDTTGIFVRAHAMNRRAELTYIESGSAGFSGSIHGFFIYELCPEEDLGDIDFTVTFSSVFNQTVLVVNMQENMVYGNSSYSKAFIEQGSDDVFYDYRLSLRNDPYYSEVTPLSIITSRDSYHTYVNAYASATSHNIIGRRQLLDMDITVFGLASEN